MIHATCKLYNSVIDKLPMVTITMNEAKDVMNPSFMNSIISSVSSLKFTENQIMILNFLEHIVQDLLTRINVMAAELTIM